jgi:hypothetical protein
VTDRYHAPYEPPAELPAHLAGRARCQADGCEAILIPGFDPPGDLCRHHAPKTPTRRKAAA